MNNYREADSKRQEEVIGFLTQSAQQLRKQGNEKEAEGLQRLCDNVRKNLFSIVVVGEFSAGKSTFLNAMMHKKILPSFTDETTATVNFLRDISCAPDGKAGVVYYREPEGKTMELEDLEPETIEKVVSVRGDQDGMKVAETIDHVDLFLDSDFLKDGVMLVDSPGLNGIAEHHREITEEQIRKSHACIFLFSADHPGSGTDFEFLRELKSRNTNVLFVLNKIDVIKQSEKETPESVVAHLTERYREQFPDDREIPHIWPLSAYMALTARDELLGRDLTDEQRSALEQRSRIGAFEDRLWKYLTQGERRHEQLSAPMDKALKTLSADTNRLEEIIRLLEQQTGSKELEKRQNDLQVAVVALQKERERASSTLKKKMRTARDHVMESAQVRCDGLNKKVQQKLAEQETLEEIRAYSRKLGDRLQKNYLSIAEELNGELQEDLVHIVDEEYQDYAGKLEERLDGNESTAGVHIEAKNFSVTDLSTGLDRELEKFEERREKLDAHIRKLKEEHDLAEEKGAEARKNERELENRTKELENLQKSRDTLYETFVAPGIRYDKVVTNEKEARGGILGAVAWLLVGSRTVQNQQIVEHREEHDKAIKERDARVKAKDEEIDRARQSVEQAKQGLTDTSEQLTVRAKRLELETASASREYDALVQNMEKKMNRAQEKKMKSLRSEIVEEVEAKSEEIIGKIRTYLREQESGYTRMVQDIVMVNINTELEKSRQALETVQQAMDGEAKARDEQLKAAKENLAATRELLNKGVALFGELDASLSDHIEKEKL